MENVVIGKAVVAYNENGIVTNAHFEPALKINLVPVLEEQLKHIAGPTPEALKQTTDLVLGAWFSKMTEIEMADRSRYEITSEVLLCEKYPNGSVKTCVIQYSFHERLSNLN